MKQQGWFENQGVAFELIAGALGHDDEMGQSRKLPHHKPQRCMLKEANP